MSSYRLYKLSEIFKALSSPQRIAILKKIEEKPLTQSELIEITSLKGGALYHHIYTLIRAGLIKKTKRGNYEVTELGRKVIEVLPKLIQREDPRSQ